MTATLFAGPSLAGAEAALPEGFRLLGPARQGDIYRAAAARPAAIGLIDGYFEGVPSVWHKEILWALSQGVAVFGSASMGALRAAELHPFGMVGVGRIFEDFRDGVLEADDEVALLHGPRETGFLPLTEPLVNVRATCAAAARGGILPESAAAALVTAARSLFYKERTWGDILGRTADRDLPAERRAAFGDWLPCGRVDQKRLDALAMIDAMTRQLDEGPAAPAPFCFEPTFLWERAVADWGRAGRRTAKSSPRRGRDLPPRETLIGLLAEGDISSAGGDEPAGP